MNLYEIDQRILALADSETGEISDFAALEALQIERETKLENAALWYKNLTAEAEMIKAETDKLTERRKACEAKAENIKRYLEFALGGEKFTTAKVACSYRKSESVQIDDVGKLPTIYVLPVEPKVDKVAIKQDIKNGKEIEGATLISKLNLSVR